MTALYIILPLLVAACLVAALCGARREDNSRYYVGGYHIYYDRKILRHIEKTKRKKP